MSKIEKFEIKISKNPLLFASREAYCVSILDTSNKKNAVLYIHEYFFKYFDIILKSDENKKIVLESLPLYHIEQYQMQSDINSPFYNQQDMFEQYCKVKYKALFEYINQMVEYHFSRVNNK